MGLGSGDLLDRVAGPQHVRHGCREWAPQVARVHKSAMDANLMTPLDQFASQPGERRTWAPRQEERCPPPQGQEAVPGLEGWPSDPGRHRRVSTT